MQVRTLWPYKYLQNIHTIFVSNNVCRVLYKTGTTMHLRTIFLSTPNYRKLIEREISSRHKNKTRYYENRFVCWCNWKKMQQDSIGLKQWCLSFFNQQLYKQNYIGMCILIYHICSVHKSNFPFYFFVMVFLQHCTTLFIIIWFGGFSKL